MKGTGKEEILEAIAMLIVVVLGWLIVAAAMVPKEFTGTEAGAFMVATGIAYSVNGLSLAEEGSISRFLSGNYDIEIGIEKDSDGPLKNYYIKVTPYRKDELLKPIDKLIFIGNLELGSDPLKMMNVTYIKFVKPSGKPVGIKRITETYFSVIKCEEPSPKQIKNYIQWYSGKNEVEEKWVKTIIMVESRFEQCAVSIAEAYGLMQLLPDTAGYVGISGEDVKENAERNIDAGTRFYKLLLEKYEKHDDKHILAAANYNCGAILNLVIKNCRDKNIYTGCWENEIKELTFRGSGEPEKQYECNRLGGTCEKACESPKKQIGTCEWSDRGVCCKEFYCPGEHGDETYNYIKRIEDCMDYYENNPDCYNVPGESGCPISNTCGRW